MEKEQKKPARPRASLVAGVDDANVYFADRKGVSIQIASDLHLEFYPKGHYPEDILTPSAPVLALLGDIGIPHQESYARFLGQMSSKFELVLVVLGNHEFYQTQGLAQTSNPVLTYEEIRSHVRGICAKLPNVRLADREVFHIGGVRVICSTLWTHIPMHAAPYAGGINDYNYIYKRDEGKTEPELISWEDTNGWHDQELAFVVEQLTKSMTCKEKNSLVLTHHSPMMNDTSSKQYQGPLQNQMNFAFSSPLEYLFRDYGRTNNSNVHTWCFGHTHFCTSVEVHGTRVLANQLGYPGERNTFKKDGVVVTCSNSPDSV